MRQTILEVNLGSLKKNYFEILKRAQAKDLVICVKSNAYGHSLVEIGRALDSLPKKSRLNGLAVATMEEGLELRRAKVNLPIYILSGVQDYSLEIDQCIRTCKFIPVISSVAMLKKVGHFLAKVKKPLALHLKFNTGMNRLGIDIEESKQCLSILKQYREIEVEGICTHLADADQEKGKTSEQQIHMFRKIISEFSKAGVHPKFIHAENSGGLSHHAFPEGNLARIGIDIYGIGNEKLLPVAKWTAQIYQIRELKKGDEVGYLGRFKAKKNTKMAVLGVGYGDGYHRILSNRSEVLIRGKRCPVIGSVSMDLIAVDITALPKVSTKDKAVLLGKDGKDEITAHELAKLAETISYEILTSVSSRVPRVVSNG